jgi:DtxR family Mn-dependent transcriptional regulator
MKQRFIVEDALKQFHRAEYEGWLVTPDALAGVAVRDLAEAGELLVRLQEDGFVAPSGRGFALTDSGRRYALQVVRAHRMFETWLAHKTGTDASEWHRMAEKAEHTLSEEEVEAMEGRLGHPRFDPHGDPIPTRHLTLPDMGEIALLDAAEGAAVQITHIEDEPASVFRKITSQGLAPGVVLRVRKIGVRQVEVEAESRIRGLDRVEARQIQVIPALDEEIRPEWSRLSDLGEGEEATIVALSAVCRGAERRRLLDLGVVPGSRVRVDLTGPFQSPRGYRIRGTMVGLRHEQAENIFVTGGEG